MAYQKSKMTVFVQAVKLFKSWVVFIFKLSLPDKFPSSAFEMYINWWEDCLEGNNGALDNLWLSYKASTDFTILSCILEQKWWNISEKLIFSLCSKGKRKVDVLFWSTVSYFLLRSLWLEEEMVFRQKKIGKQNKNIKTDMRKRICFYEK